ncbi:MAG TPA: DUF1592 domain-containing protein, partial [Abditibacteriaceae bacterium]|nr:DUF1592 domain-containing protein [Abditibacteriaceae bacterium]
PGRVTMRRLNRQEYNNTIRDLFGLDLHPADEFPSDDVGYGFDNIGDVLSISPLLMEKYLLAAEQISEKAILVPQRVARKWSGGELIGENGTDESGSYGFAGPGDAGIEYSFAAAGTYTVRVKAWEQHAGDQNAQLQLGVDGKNQATIDVSALRNAPAVYEQKLTIPAGRHRITLSFQNDFYKPELPEGERDRNVYVQSVELDGPLESETRALPASQKQLVFVTPEQIAKDRTVAARLVVTQMARRLYRRPPAPEDVERLMRAFDLASGESFERGVQIALQAALVSPRFLFRVETVADTKPTAKAPRAKAQAVQDRVLDSWELASRLSYFLWSSTPDEALMKEAQSGALQKPQVLQAQARRMLRDPKARALADNFAGQWLMLRNLRDVEPDPAFYPNWNDQLRAAMKQESLLFFEEVVQKNRSITDFLDGKFTYLNENLAKHYGISSVRGANFQRIALTGELARQRGGILTQASVLTVTSNPTRTSPVKRGKWVLENFWGTPPPPAPPGVAQLKESRVISTTLTMRKRMEEHRKNPDCASCHSRMDPIGFSLENYDATGKWRVKEGALPIDTSGVLSDGTRFVGPVQLKTILMKKQSQFVRAFSEKMLTYSLGRGLETSDKCVVDVIYKHVGENKNTFGSLIEAIVVSDSFRKQRVELPVAKTPSVKTTKKR